MCVVKMLDVGDWKHTCWEIISTVEVYNVYQKCTLFPFLSSRRRQIYVTICGSSADFWSGTNSNSR